MANEEPGPAFSPEEHLTIVNGAAYLEAKWRLVWFREDHPDGQIETDMVEFSRDHAIFKATVTTKDGEGKPWAISTGYGSEFRDRFESYIEAAETKAIGRALAGIGYGTQFAGEFTMTDPSRAIPAEPPSMAKQLHDAATAMGRIAPPDVPSIPDVDADGLPPDRQKGLARDRPSLPEPGPDDTFIDPQTGEIIHVSAAPAPSDSGGLAPRQTIPGKPMSDAAKNFFFKKADRYAVRDPEIREAIRERFHFEPPSEFARMLDMCSAREGVILTNEWLLPHVGEEPSPRP